MRIEPAERDQQSTGSLHEHVRHQFVASFHHPVSPKVRHQQSAAPVADGSRTDHGKAVIPEPPVPLLATGADAAVVTAEWRRRTVAEYTSAAIAQHVTLWMIRLGAPPDLIRDGLRVVEDELVHSELSAQVADAAGGTAAAAMIEETTLTLPCDDLATALVSSVVRFFCIGETLAVPLFRMLRQGCSVPVASRALDRVLRDETRHRQFGWDVLDWALLAGGPSTLELIVEESPAMLDEVTSLYAIVRGDRSDEQMAPEIRAWGLAPPGDYASTVTSAIDAAVLPRMAVRGIQPRH